MTETLSPTGLAHLHDLMARHVDDGRIPGLITLVAAGPDEVHVDAMGTPAFDDPTPLARDAIFRIASITKPIVAAAAMTMIDDGTLSLDQPVDELLPELADRRVLRTPESELDDTVPATRSITVEDLLSFRLGIGCVMAPPGSTPFLRAEAKIDLQSINGPPWPPTVHDPDSWMAGLGSLPLLEQPGEQWRYNTGAQVLGVLLARAAGRPLPDVVHERVLEPLAMVDTGFVVPADQLERLTTMYVPDPETGEVSVRDASAESWWSRPTSFPDGSGGLASTIDDVGRFAAMMLAGGRAPGSGGPGGRAPGSGGSGGRAPGSGGPGSGNGRRVLSEESVALMTTDRLTADQRAANGLFLDEGCGWGLGLQVPATGTAGLPFPWGYGWDGGSGTAWRTNPSTGVIAILLTQVELTSPEPPTIYRDFWAGVNAASGVPR